MAHPELFKSFDIGDPPLNQSFVDAGLGCNNPLAHVLAEVKTLYPERYVASVTSIGTGHTRTIQIPDTSFLRHLLPLAAIIAMKAIATDTERVAEEIARRFNSTEGVYFRLSVDQGMQTVGMDEWEQLNEVLDHTRAYTRYNFAPLFMPNSTHSFADGEIQEVTSGPNTPFRIRRCPAPTPIFTGREAKICRVESCITASPMERKVCIVHGLGGAGKTQIALKVIERTYHKWKEVIFVDASTKESIESSLKDVAVAKRFGDTHQAALEWLESCCEQWLIVLDNLDDPSLPIRNYIPRGNHGSIIITTRLSGMLSLAQGTHSDCSVSSMDPNDALALLLKLAYKRDREPSPEETEEAKALLQELGYFALAIVHAGSFIGQSPHMPITEYRALLKGQKRQALEAYTKLPQAIKADDYGHNIYTAWLMCYNLLGSRAQKLLWLIAALHHTGVTVDIFRRAAQAINSYKTTFPTTHSEDSARQELQNFLCNFVDDSQNWDGLLFTQTINEVSSHSLLEYDHMNQAYRIHVLVQGWVHTVVPHEIDLADECARALLSMSIPLDKSLESIRFRINIGPHVDKVLEAPSTISPNYAGALFRVLEDRGWWAKAELLNTRTLEIAQQVLGNDHPNTLNSMDKLACVYYELGRFEEARALISQVLDMRKQVLGEYHIDTLESMNNLACSYSNLGRFEDARALHSQALDMRKQILGRDHPDTLESMSNLAVTYLRLVRLEDARALLSQALGTVERVLGRDHPMTLKCTENLAFVYSELGRVEEAKVLLSHTLDSRKQVLGKSHPETLESTHKLGCVYLKFGQLEDARSLLSQATGMREQVLGRDHPDTLASMYNFARVHSKMGRFEDARALYSQELDAVKRSLGEDHPDTLISMVSLAHVYSRLDRPEDAKALFSQVVDSRKRVLGNDHPDTLESIIELANIHLVLRQFREAEELQLCVAKFIQVFGENHEYTDTARRIVKAIQKHQKKHIGGFSWYAAFTFTISV
ncbi:unnamed protein product [Rhizoctonia solani]|uniref:NB-ARC domain-containing protein n=1 Tax=Rhizoctonia solani TaxID=456999 RepID=A0A8H3DC05_9AGAM|nr:unnamed protein product [Rhizoctonia solani]